MLTEQCWDGAPLERVVLQALEHLAETDRLAVEGPQIWVAPRAALALALALHELGTNAAKYGALTRDGGRISIRWRSEGDRLRATLHFEADGLRCAIDASLEAIQAREAEIG